MFSNSHYTVCIHPDSYRMVLTNLIQSINHIFSHASTWLYAMQNTRQANGTSNYFLIALAAGIVGVSVFAEWLTLRSGQSKIFLKWLRHQHWVIRFFTGYEHFRTRQDSTMHVDVPDITRRLDVPATGLTQSEIEARMRDGLVNAVHRRTSRSYRQIFFTNIFTRFNALLAILYVVILLVGAPQDSLFGIIIVFNAMIGIVQELRAKWALDRLAILTATSVRVVRDGKERTILVEAVVQDDVLRLHIGDAVPVDGTLITVDGLEVNESMVTGEAEPVHKRVGDPLYSGSFVVAGSGLMQAVYVGEASYVRRLAHAAQQFALASSELRRGINQILRYVTWLLIPTALLLFITQILFMQNGWRDALAASAGGVVNMVPDGLVLLTSVVMALAVVRLAKKRVLIQELSAVEMLARVDVLCLDKTGTLTKGEISVDQLVRTPASVQRTDQDVKSILGTIAHVQEQTSTLTAIAKAFPAPKPPLVVEENIPFSSARKWSAVTLAKYGTWILGAAEHLVEMRTLPPEIRDQYSSLLTQGRRMIALGHTETPVDRKGKDHELQLSQVTLVAFISMHEKLRTGAAKTLQYFREQGIDVKIVSGDNAQTVAAVAREVGQQSTGAISGPDVPANAQALRSLVEKESVFGRILPEQKQQIIRALQDRGHVVAMVGDGVNDVLAIKAADFSIAMGSGSEASRATAQLVLLDNDFSVLPDVIAEGRRIIANIERTANLFITKTAYVVTIALAVGIALVPFPFLPRHLTLIGTLTIGIPALVLSFRPNAERAKPGFVARIFQFSIPAGTIVASCALLVFAVTRVLYRNDIDLARTSATFLVFGTGIALLTILAKPLTTWVKWLIGLLVVVMVSVVVLPSVREFFGLELPTPLIWSVLALTLAAGVFGLRYVERNALRNPIGKI